MIPVFFPLRQPSAVSSAWRTGACLAATLLVAGCSVLPGGGSGPSAAASSQIAELGPIPTAPGVPPPDTPAEAWQMQFAQALHDHQASKVFEGIPQNPLYAIIVLEIELDAKGTLRNVRNMRSPPHGAKERDAAIASVRAGGPYPPPPRQLLKNGVAKFTETWLFNNDRRFRLRSLAAPQSPE
ncbi:hypothetical protein FXN63_05155 [Pigmentiphaga aceris]|uniref:Energy transducer TonB n=1 Tax=Pigmentiphaga aceris TaxID=1940612 RepID=A0A5C0AUA2_9BURK|nr:hypothetical protein [Pigmentiphaga aceris]QEI05296.1 hypothetical protein FXN63_05155 [Pigmentiphaga aceris]